MSFSVHSGPPPLKSNSDHMVSSFIGRGVMGRASRLRLTGGRIAGQRHQHLVVQPIGVQRLPDEHHRLTDRAQRVFWREVLGYPCGLLAGV